MGPDKRVGLDPFEFQHTGRPMKSTKVLVSEMRLGYSFDHSRNDATTSKNAKLKLQQGRTNIRPKS